LAASYRTVEQFEEVLDVDSWRSVCKLIFRRSGSWYPSKIQIIAFFWVAILVAFNVFTALLGLTHSIEVSEDWIELTPGNLSVVELSYLSTGSSAFYIDPSFYDYNFQQNAINLYGHIGQNFKVWYAQIHDRHLPTETVFTKREGSDYWYRFIDLSPDLSAESPRLRFKSHRTVNSTATCLPLNIRTEVM
jgi:hypothetical protein